MPEPRPAAVDPALLPRYDVAGPRYTSYPPVPDWANDVDELDYRVALSALGRDPLAVYVHLPFCAARCLYCGCSAVATSRRDVVDHYLDRLAREIGMVAECLDERPAVTEMHWGGGTPNYLDPHELERTFTMLSTVLDLGSEAHGTECSIEADPRLVTRDQLRMLRDLGFTRLSYGVQDLDPDVQEAIGRVQPASLVFEAIESARAAGFDKLNVDLLYGLPQQTERSFADTLERIVAIRPSRIACFGYAHVPWMRPHQRRMDESAMPGRDDRFALFALAVERLEDAGYQWIGFDHFALPDDPLAVAARDGRLHRDFMGYTTRRTGALLGLGVSSIGEVDGCFVQSHAHLGDWQRAVDAGVLPLARAHRLTDDDRHRGAAIRELLCHARLPFSLLPDDDGATLDRYRAFEADGLVLIGRDAIEVTRTGRFFLRNLAMVLDAYRSAPAGNGARFSRTV